MKKIILLLVVLLVLGGGGGGYYYLFMMNEVPEVEPPPPAPDIRFIEMEELRIPVIRSEAVVNYVVIFVTLETIGGDNEEVARSLMPRLRNAFLTDLNGYFAYVSVEDRILVKEVKRRLQILSDRVLGRGIVNDILIVNALKQKG